MDKIIGFDIDGTITDDRYFQKSLLAEFCNLNGKTEKEIKSSVYWDNKFKDFSFPRTVSSAPIREHTKELFDELHKRGYKVYIVTRRDEYYDKGLYKGSMMKDDTISRFHRIGLEYDRIFFSCFNKAKTLKENGINCLVDDDPTNIFQVANFMPAINIGKQKLEGKNIYNIEDFDVDNFIHLLESVIKW